MYFDLIPAFNNESVESYIKYKDKIVGTVSHHYIQGKIVTISDLANRGTKVEDLDKTIRKMLSLLIDFEPGLYCDETTLVLGNLYLDGPVISISNHEDHKGLFYVYEGPPSVYRKISSSHPSFKDAKAAAQELATLYLEEHINDLSIMAKSLTCV